jgi:uncharacterized protein (DUF362 family)
LWQGDDNADARSVTAGTCAHHRFPRSGRRGPASSGIHLSLTPLEHPAAGIKFPEDVDMAPLTRRSFLHRSLVASAAALLPLSFSRASAGNPPGRPAVDHGSDIVAVTGSDCHASTLAAVSALGGIQAFVPRGATVGLLVNSPFKNVGASVHPDVTLAVIQLCRQAGCREIRYLKDPHDGYWQRGARFTAYEDQIRALNYVGGDHHKVAIPGGLAVQDVKVVRGLTDCDVFINLAIVKHHKGVQYTGLLKNMMGLCPFATNSYFHWGTLKLGWYADLAHLTQCIADLNLVRRPDLCILDATEFITANGPWGPGPLKTPRTVIAGTDPVAMDTHGCSLLGLHPDEVLMIAKAAAHGLGRPDPDGQRIRRLKI